MLDNEDDAPEPAEGAPEPIGAELAPPTWLSHKPLAALAYEKHDGPYAGDSDCKFLSLGTSTWDEATLSLKAFRHTGERWSRQSEELPLHRVVDLAILLALAVDQIEDLPIVVPPDTFINQPEKLEIPVKGSPLELYAAKHQLRDEALIKQLAVLYARLHNLFGPDKD